MFIRVGERIINSVSFGIGEPPFVAVSGWIGTWQMWRQPLEVLSRHRQCIAYDHSGSGQTLCNVGKLTCEGQIDDVFRVMDAMEVERCWLCGESHGGFVAASAVLQDPSRFYGLVIVSSAPSWRIDADRSRVVFAEALQASREDALKAFVDRCVPEPDSPHLRRWLLTMLLESEPEYGPALLRQVKVDIRNRLNEITIPTLIIHGAMDSIEPLRGGEPFNAGIKGSRLLVLDDAGHVPTLTHPIEVAEAIVDFALRSTATAELPPER